MSDKSKEKNYVMGVEFPSDEEMEGFDRQMIERLEQDSKYLEEAMRSGEAERVLDSVEDTDFEADISYKDKDDKKDGIFADNYFKYNKEGKILVDSLKY